MNKNHFYIMSDTIPIMPLPETIENWIPSEIRPHPGNDPIEVELFTISHEDLIVDTPTIQSIQTEIKRMYDENEIPKNYQFYYYVLNFTVNNNDTLDTGILSNQLANSQETGFQTSKLFLKPNGITEGEEMAVKMYFIFHPSNYENQNVTDWYIAFSKDNTPFNLYVYLEENTGISTYYAYSSANSGGKYTIMGLLPWTGNVSELMYPEGNLTLYASNRLPIDNPY